MRCNTQQGRAKKQLIYAEFANLCNVYGEDPRKVGEVVSSSGSESDQSASSNSSSSVDSSTSASSPSGGEASLSNAELAKELREAADRLEKAGSG
jgi:phosphatidate phosphatase PAH1